MKAVAALLGIIASVFSIGGSLSMQANSGRMVGPTVPTPYPTPVSPLVPQYTQQASNFYTWCVQSGYSPGDCVAMSP
jgi:hypothetical protein